MSPDILWIAAAAAGLCFIVTVAAEWGRVVRQYPRRPDRPAHRMDAIFDSAPSEPAEAFNATDYARPQVIPVQNLAEPPAIEPVPAASQEMVGLTTFAAVMAQRCSRSDAADSRYAFGQQAA